MEKKKTKVLTSEDFGGAPEEKKVKINTGTKGAKAIKKALPKEHRGEDEKKTATPGEIRLMKERMDTRFKNQGFGDYPNRKYRRTFKDKNANKRTQLEIDDGMTQYEKWTQGMVANVIQGERLHNAYINLIVQEQIAEEQALDDRVKKSLKEVFGSKIAAEIFSENKRLQRLNEDKIERRAEKNNVNV